jgi:hypothetical protein
MNIVFAIKYRSRGVSVASSIAGIVMFIIIMHFSKDKIRYLTILKNIWKYFVAAMFMFLMIVWINFTSSLLTLIIQILFGTLTYFTMIILLRDELVMRLIGKIIKKFGHKE